MINVKFYEDGIWWGFHDVPSRWFEIIPAQDEDEWEQIAPEERSDQPDRPTLVTHAGERILGVRCQG